MRKLHVVGFTNDLDGLIFSTRKGAKSGSFVVAIGEELMEKLDEVQRLRNGDLEAAPGLPARRDERERRTRPESLLTPREIQSRLRAGRSIEEVAREAGVDTDWVERFAAPILAEQRQVVELARSLTFTKSRLGESAEPLGESVAANLADRGLRVLDDEFDASWSAYQLRDGVWTVRFRYRSRGRQQQATWELDVANNRLVSRDRMGSDLGYVERARRRRRLAESAEDTAATEAVAEASPVVVRVSARRPQGTVAVTPVRKRAATTTAKAKGRAATAAAKARKSAKAPAAKSAAAKSAAAGIGRASKTVAVKTRGTKAVPVKAPAVKAPAAKAAVVKAAAAKAKKAAKPARVVTAKKATKTRAAAPTKAARTRAQATKGRGAERSTPAPPATGAPGAPARPPRPVVPRPAGPKFGTDGTRLGTPAALGFPRRRGPGAVAPPAPPARRMPPREAASFRPEPPRSRPPVAESRTGNGAGPARRPAAPPRPAPSPAPAPAPERRRPPVPRPAPPPRPPVDDDLEFDLDLDDIVLDDEEMDVVEPEPGPEPAAGGEPEAEPERRRPAIAIGPPPGEDRSEDRNGGDDDGAFVIRPRISARQASELRFDSESPRRWQPPLTDITAVPPVAAPAHF